MFRDRLVDYVLDKSGDREYNEDLLDLISNLCRIVIDGGVMLLSTASYCPEDEVFEWCTVQIDAVMESMRVKHFLKDSNVRFDKDEENALMAVFNLTVLFLPINVNGSIVFVFYKADGFTKDWISDKVEYAREFLQPKSTVDRKIHATVTEDEDEIRMILTKRKPRFRDFKKRETKLTGKSIKLDNRETLEFSIV